MSDTTPCIASYDRQKYHTIEFKQYKVSNIGPYLQLSQNTYFEGNFWRRRSRKPIKCFACCHHFE